jgi:hypothetical protein
LLVRRFALNSLIECQKCPSGSDDITFLDSLSECFRQIQSSVSENVNSGRSLTNHLVSLGRPGRSDCPHGLLVPLHKSTLTALSRVDNVFDFQATSVHRIRDHELTKRAP